MKWYVLEDTNIFNFLQANTDLSVKQIKQYLKFENVYVNQKIVTNIHHPLYKNDQVEIFSKKNSSSLSILYEDKDMIIVDKPNHLLTISTDKEKEKTLYHMVSSYIKKNNRQGKIFIVHRLDKETSGIVIFAKNEKVKKHLQNHWNDTKRYYQAIVHGKVNKEHELLKTHLMERGLRVYPHKEGVLALTEYWLLKTNHQYSLLDIQIHTGRKNQIRCQLWEIHHPIVGDTKYGIKDKAKRLYLHAYKIEFKHPISGKMIKITSPLPQEFHTLIKGR